MSLMIDGVWMSVRSQIHCLDVCCMPRPFVQIATYEEVMDIMEDVSSKQVCRQKCIANFLHLLKMPVASILGVPECSWAGQLLRILERAHTLCLGAVIIPLGILSWSP